MNYYEKLTARIASIKSNLCVGLDPQDKTIALVQRRMMTVIHDTLPFAAAFKANVAFFLAHAGNGVDMLKTIQSMIPKEVPFILDGKWGDVGSTQEYYAKFAFEVIGADAVTLNPWMGKDSLFPFWKYEDKGFYLVAVGSNAGAHDIQLKETKEGGYVHEVVFDMADSDEAPKHCGFVLGLPNIGDVGAGFINADSPLLIPGLGAQGGSIKDLKTFDADYFDQRMKSLLVNVSRGICYPGTGENFVSSAEHWRREIKQVD